MTPSDRVIPFVKANACGNDFLIIDGVDVPADIADFSRRICDRHHGVGADGVEWLFPAPDADVRGAPVQRRRIGSRDFRQWHPLRRCLSLLGAAERKFCHPNRRRNQDLLADQSRRIQLRVRNRHGRAQVGDELLLRLAFAEVRGIPVSMGNPHYVMFVKEFSPTWQAEAAEIGRQPRFQQGTNVELVIVKDESNLEVRFFERGVGETQSSGTGSCASAVAAIAAKRAQSPVRVHAPGGVQTVRWEEVRSFSGGPAQLVCRGEFFI